MKGDQTVELSIDQLALTYAIDHHMTFDNCCGSLIYKEADSKNGKTNVFFYCLSCHQKILIEITKINPK